MQVTVDSKYLAEFICERIDQFLQKAENRFYEKSKIAQATTDQTVLIWAAACAGSLSGDLNEHRKEITREMRNTIKEHFGKGGVE